MMRAGPCSVSGSGSGTSGRTATAGAGAGGAAAGAAAGSLVGALIGLGVPEEEARYYEGEARSGRTLVTVRAEGRYDEASAITRRHGGYDRFTAPAGTSDV